VTGFVTGIALPFLPFTYIYKSRNVLSTDNSIS
jgi:hypothetical protein